MKESWQQIIERFDGLVAQWGIDNPYARDVAGVAAVAKHINATWLRDRLFGGTSMHSLRICQIDVPNLFFPGPELTPHLYVGPRHHGWGAGGGVEFTYLEGWWRGGKKWPRNRERQWRRVVSPDQAVDRFNRFLDQLRCVSSQDEAALMASTPIGSNAQ